MSSPFHGMTLPSYDQEIIDFAVFNSISYKLTHDYMIIQKFIPIIFGTLKGIWNLDFFQKVFLFYYIQNDDLSSSGCDIALFVVVLLIV